MEKRLRFARAIFIAHLKHKEPGAQMAVVLAAASDDSAQQAAPPPHEEPRESKLDMRGRAHAAQENRDRGGREYSAAARAGKGPGSVRAWSASSELDARRVASAGSVIEMQLQALQGPAGRQAALLHQMMHGVDGVWDETREGADGRCTYRTIFEHKSSTAAEAARPPMPPMRGRLAAARPGNGCGVAGASDTTTPATTQDAESGANDNCVHNERRAAKPRAAPRTSVPEGTVPATA
jgi:hypothetical protein